jgi:glycerol-1-phosphate dehydrogenase [NAD(P)+]
MEGKNMDEPKVYAYSGAINSLAEILGSEGIRSVFVYADRNTYEAAGRRAVEILESAGIKAKEYIFKSKRVEPNETTVGLAAMSFDPSVDAVLGVGSGVINDVSKIIANNSGKKYIILATAPSMDGYASAASSMSVEGLKISLPSKCADIIIGDIDIIKNAPMKMMLAGLGDMLAKYTAICEWRISNIINGEPISEEIAESVRESLQRCVKNAEGLIRREPAATEAVFEGLVLCGLAMKRAGSSRPASGIEHYLSHIWDMRGEEFGTPTDLHGLQCAVGTYISVSLFEKIKSVRIDKEKALAFCAGLIECTNGCILFAKTQGVLTLPLTAFIITFGGVSVLVQSISFLKEAKVNIKVFLLSKVLQAINSFIICLAIIKFTNLTL